MEDNKRIWLSVIGAVLMVAAWSVWAFAAGQYAGFMPVVYCLASVAVPLLFWGLVEGWLYVQGRNAENFAVKQNALSQSSMGNLLKAAQGVHPEVLSMILGERARRWGLVSGTKSKDKSPYSVLIERPQVNDRFVAHVLKMSNPTSIMPKRLLSDGDKSFDPAGIVTAYEMYDALISLLEAEMKVTKPFDNKPGYWLNDWDPETVAMDFGIDLDQYEYAVKATDLNQAPANVKAAVQDLTPLAK